MTVFIADSSILGPFSKEMGVSWRVSDLLSTQLGAPNVPEEVAKAPAAGVLQYHTGWGPHHS
jgi:hypothetical protein